MKRASKWILLAPELFRAPGGIARVSRHYLQALAMHCGDRDLAVVVLNDEAVSPAHLADCAAPQAHGFGCNRSKLRCAHRLWRESAGDHVHVLCTHVAMAPLLNLLRRVRPEVTFDVVVHGIEVWRPLPRAQQAALSQARLILSVSDYTRRELVARYPHLDGHTQVLPNALDPGFSHHASRQHEQSTVSCRILTVSRLAAHDWEKGIDHLIEAMPHVQRSLPHAHLHIVGDGVDRPRLESIAARLPDPDAVRFLGRLDDDGLQAELATCQLFALPSRKEGFGLVYLEAMAHGKPCIVAKAGGAPEVVDQHSGMIIPYGDVPLLAETLIQALQHPWDSQRVRARAQEFSFPAFANRWRTLSSLSA